MSHRRALLTLGALLAGGGLHAQPTVDLDIPDLVELEFESPAGITITGPVDLRFFGTFCQPAPKKFCKSIPILPDPCVTLRDLRLRLDHLTEPTGGMLRGGGGFVLDGEGGTLTVAGAVTGWGQARFAAAAPGLGMQQGGATLSADGLELLAAVQDRTIVLRKDTCGNGYPRVSLRAPFGPTFPFGQSVMLASEVEDEDTDFPDERVVFTSDRQGLLGGYRPHSRTLMTTALQPGGHRVTVTVTDSGGLAGQASLALTIVNRPPEAVRIVLPVAGAALVAEAPVLLRGTALDPDTGFLSGGALAWSAQDVPGGPYAPLGSGTEVVTVFAEPVDPLRLRLTATDGAGSQASVEQLVRVVESTGNAPPVVAIVEPDPTQSSGTVVGGAYSGEPKHLRAIAWDAEDAPEDLDLRWEFAALEGLGGPPDPTPPVPNPAPILGTLAADVTFDVVGDLYYRITFSATDSGGAASSESVEIKATSTIIE